MEPQATLGTEHRKPLLVVGDWVVDDYWVTKSPLRAGRGDFYFVLCVPRVGAEAPTLG